MRAWSRREFAKSHRRSLAKPVICFAEIVAHDPAVGTPRAGIFGLNNRSLCGGLAILSRFFIGVYAGHFR
jgi:hypothetical protein